MPHLRYGADSDQFHLRHELLSALAEDKNRHLTLLTATPHSGNVDAFHNLLGLLDPQFAALP
jgi:hypothetical protein